MSFPAGQSAASGRPAQLTVVETSRPSSDGGRRTRPGRVPGLEPFAVEVQRHDHVAIVQPRGELDVASVEMLRAALDGIEPARRLVLDLRGLSFMDSTGLHLLMALHQRAQRDGFQLTVVAPAAPLDRAIQLCGLDQVLPFAAPDDAVDSEPAKSASGPQDGS